MNMKRHTPLITGLLSAILISLVFPEVGVKVAFVFESWYTITWMYIHHITQLLLAVITILIIAVFRKESLSSWGFNFNKAAWSVRVALLFALVWFIITYIVTTKSNPGYNLNPVNIISDLFFDFIITPLSEEILFRGLIMGILLLVIKQNLKLGQVSISYAGIITALLFSLSHIGINYTDFTLNINWVQLIFAFWLGIFYAYMRDKTGNLLGPVIAHGASDGLITLIMIFT